MYVSHPLAKFPSQLAKPATQLLMMQAPPEQVAKPLGTFDGHTLPHDPQLFGSVLRLELQLPPQSWKGGLQEATKQVPEGQVMEAALGARPQTLPQPPQLDVE